MRLPRDLVDQHVGAGIHSGDLLVVDRPLEPAVRNVIAAVLDGELTVKRLFKQQRVLHLPP